MIRLGTRTSRLARAQARTVAEALEGENVETELVPTNTLGDRRGKTPVHELGVAGAFTTALERGLVDGEIDLAVHSLKDLPTEAPEGLTVSAVLERGRPGDVVLARPTAHDEARPLGLVEGARVATSGPRRQSQLLAAREDLAIANVRGNVDTRLRKLREGRFDALVTARVVLDRMELDLSQLVVHELAPERFPPAPGQAAIAVQARECSPADAIAQRLDHARSHAAVDAERDLLARLGGGCGLALGAWAHPIDDGWRLTATFAGHDWDTTHRPRLRREENAGARLDALVEATVDPLAEIQPEPRRPPLADVPPPETEGPSLLVVASRPTAEAWAAMLRHRGHHAHPLPTRSFRPTEPSKRERARLQEADWIALTSRQAAGPLAAALDEAPADAYLAAVGPATARALQGQGLPCHVIAPEATGESLGEELARLAAGQRVLLAQGDTAHGRARERLASADVTLDVWQAYETRELAPDVDGLEVQRPAEAALVMSPRNAQALPHEPGQIADTIVAVGPSTAQALREAGLDPVVADAPRPDAVEDVIP